MAIDRSIPRKRIMKTGKRARGDERLKRGEEGVGRKREDREEWRWEERGLEIRD